MSAVTAPIPHGRGYRTRAFAAGASAVTFLVTIGVLAAHDGTKANATPSGDDDNTTVTVTTPTTTFSPFGGRALPGRSRSDSGGFGQPDTSSRGS